MAENMEEKRESIRKRVLEFIGRRFGGDCNWIDGNCYYFAKILDDRFPGGEICYDVINGHFIFRYCGDCYDWTGIVHPEINKLVLWKDFWKYDPQEYSRILRDCVM